jgi:hypothetical protein
MHLHHLQRVLSLYSAKVIKLINVINPIMSVDYNVYIIVTANDKIQSIKRCELSTAIIAVHISC